MSIKSDGTLRHAQEAIRDKCGVTGLGRPMEPCPNGISGLARLRCSIRGNEKQDPFSKQSQRSTEESKGFLVCTTCHQRAMHDPGCQGEYSHVGRYDKCH